MAAKKKNARRDQAKLIASLVIVVASLLLIALLSTRGSEDDGINVASADSCAGYISTVIEEGFEISFNGGVDSNLQLIVENTQQYEDYEARYSCQYVALSHYVRSYDEQGARATLTSMKHLDTDTVIFDEWGVQPEPFDQLENRVVFIEQFVQTIDENANGGLPVLSEESRP